MLNSKARKTIITLAAAVGFLFTGTPIASAAVTVDCNASGQPCGTPCSVGDTNCWSASSVTCPLDRRLDLELLRAQLANKEQGQELAAATKTIAAQHARIVRQERKLRHQARLIRRLRRELAAS